MTLQLEPVGGPDAACASSAPARKLVGFVATYHYVRPRNSDGVTGITPSELAAQLRAIQQRYRIVPVEVFVAGAAEDDNLALLTFDDGLRDQFAAAQVLDDFGVCGVFYTPMRPYSDESDRWCPQHLLHALADHLGWAELERRAAPYLVGLELDSGDINRLYHYEQPHKRRLKYALAFGLTPGRAACVLREINARVGLRPEDWYLSAGQLSALQDAGHSLGGHGFDHLPYRIMTAKQQAADLHRAVQTMNQLFGALPRTFACPFGQAGPETVALARGCGYVHMFTTADRVDARDVLSALRRPTPRSIA